MRPVARIYFSILELVGNTQLKKQDKRADDRAGDAPQVGNIFLLQG